MLSNALTGCSSSHCYRTSIHRKTAGTPVYLSVWNTEKRTTFKTLPDTETKELKQIYWQMYSLDVYSTGHWKCQPAVQLVWKDWEDSYGIYPHQKTLSITEHKCLNKDLLSSIIFDVLLKLSLITFLHLFFLSLFSSFLPQSFPLYFKQWSNVANNLLVQQVWTCTNYYKKKLLFTCSLCGSQPNRLSDLERDMSNRKSVHARVAPVHKADNRCISSSDNFKVPFQEGFNSSDSTVCREEVTIYLSHCNRTGKH